MFQNFIFYFLVTFFSSVQLLGQEKPKLVVSSGHHQSLICVDISPNGKYVASGGSDNLVKVYDMRLQQELNTFTHTDKVSFVEFSRNENFLMSASRNELLIHSHPEGKLVLRKELDLTDEYTFYITKDNTLYIAQEDAGVFACNINTGEVIKKYPDIESGNFLIMPDGKTLVSQTTNEAGDEGVGFYSFPEGELLDFVPVEGLNISRFESSRDGKTIAFESKTCEIAFLDVKTKTVKPQRVTAGVGMLNIMKLTPNGKQLITSTFDNKVCWWDVKNGKNIKEIADISPSDEGTSMAMNIKDVDFSDDGEMAVFCYSDLIDGKPFYTVEWFNAESMKSIGKHAGDVKLSLSISIDKSGKILSTGTVSGDMGVKCLNISKGSQKAFLPGAAYHGSGGRYLCAVDDDPNKSNPQLNIYRMPAVRKVKSFDVNGLGNNSMSPSGKYVTMVDVRQPEDGDYTNGGAVPIMRIWDVDSEKEVVHIERTIMDMPRNCLFNKDETKAYVLYSGKIEIVDLSTGEIEKTTEVKLNLSWNNVISPDGTQIIESEPDGVYAVNINTGERKVIIELEELTVPMSVTLSPDNTLLGVSCMRLNKDMPNRVLVYDWSTKTLQCELVGHTSVVSQLVIGHENKNLFSVDNNGIIAMWDLDLCKTKASFLAFGAEDYMMISPDGFYKSSKGNLAKVGFRQKGKLYTFDQFDLRYNRPDKALKSIGIASDRQIEMYRKAYSKRLSRMGFTEEDFSNSVSAPELEIMTPESLPLTTTSDYVDVSLKAWDSNYDLDRLNITVNGVPIYGKLGKSLKESNMQNLEEKYRIKLTNGVNIIQASVMNSEGIESTRETYSIECKKPTTKPDLYIIAVGISNYQDSSMNLTYSNKDAEDVVKIFKERDGANNIFNKTHVQLFTNEKATKENILAAKSKLKNSRPDDHVILFYSGHGVIDEQLDYYLSTHDLKFEQPNGRGINFDDFKDLIDDIPARNRLIFVDACHSGEIDKEEVELPADDIAQLDDDKVLSSKGFSAKGKKIIGLGNTFELMKELFVELRKESGATIIASSAGKEYSLESPIWKNGVFTFAIKEGLVDKKADLNNDQSISVSELKSYLYVRVQELSDGKQTPTVRRENLQKDYTIY